MYQIVQGFPKYRVGRNGSVWSKWSGRWKRLKPIRSGKVYRAVHLARGGKIGRHYVHRLVLAAFVGPCPEGHETRHLDGNPRNNRLENLCYGTAAENAQDRERHGTIPRGEKSANAKLTEADVRAARDMHLREDMSLAEIGRILGVSKATVARAINGETWAHVLAA